jgi:Fic family protein
MSYRSLAKTFYSDTSTDRFTHNELLAEERRNAESTFRTGFDTPTGELFLAVPRELSLLHEHVLRHERRISTSMRLLPPVARTALVTGLVVDEVVSTNELEGVHSTRRQISDILATIDGVPGHGEDRRFREFAKLYLGISDEGRLFPSTPEDIRLIYDLVMRGENLGDDAPDGTLFRRGRVDIIGYGNKVLHEGLFPEALIIDGIKKMLSIVNSVDIPETYSAIIGHYLFEYIHPFYDGNGRTGRYLLALYLSRPLSLVTSLSLSRIIAENRDSYYRSFNEVEKKLNHGELTLFVMNILESVSIAQDQLDADLTNKRVQLDTASERLGSLVSTLGISDKEAEIIFQLAQLDLFGAYPEASVKEISEHLKLSTQQTRRYLTRLEDKGVIKSVRKRPLLYVLSDTTRDNFELPDHEETD